MTLTEFGIGCAAGVLLSCLWMLRLGRCRGIRPEQWLTYFCICLPCVFICARLVWMLSNVTYFAVTIENLSASLRFWEGGYSMAGAVFGALLACLITGPLTGQSVDVLLDEAVASMPLGIAVVRLVLRDTGVGAGKDLGGIFVLTNSFGDTVTSVSIWELIAALVLFFILRVIQKHHREGRTVHPDGDVCLNFLVLYGAAQVVFESMKNDGHMIVIHFVKIQQILALVMILTAAVVWTVRRVHDGVPVRRILVPWIISAAAIALIVRQEFAVDASENLFVDYLLMALGVAVLAVSVLTLGAEPDELPDRVRRQKA